MGSGSRRRRNAFVSVGDVDLRGAGLSASRARELRLKRAWYAAAGGQVARRATPIRLARGTLEIELLDAGWEPVLRRLAPALLARMLEIDASLAIRRFRIFRAGESGVKTETVPAPEPPAERDGGRGSAASASAPAAPAPDIRTLAERYLSRSGSR